MDNKKIGFLIAESRKERGMTQRELAGRLHVSDRAVSKWERGLNLPDVALFESLCRELGLSVTELLRGEREEPSVPKLEQAVNDTVELAKGKERSSRRNRRVALVLAVLLLAAAGLLGRYVWKEHQRQALYDQDGHRPEVVITHYVGSSKSVRVEPFPVGVYGPFESDGTLIRSDPEIERPPGQTPYVPDLEVGMSPIASFTLIYEKTEQQVRVLRWPLDQQGTGAGLEDGEAIGFYGGGEAGYTFDIEPGYLYSVVISWGDGYYVEYPFRTI